MSNKTSQNNSNKNIITDKTTKTITTSNAKKITVTRTIKPYKKDFEFVTIIESEGVLDVM